MATVIDGDFEWDDHKAASNRTKHGISFEEAQSALVDPAAVFDSDDASGEERLIAIGMSIRARVLVVVHIERGVRTRIVSARKATAVEETTYANG